MLLGDEVASDVASLFDGQAKAGHHGHLLHNHFVAVVRTSGMVEVEDERKIVLRVILGAQILLFERAVGTRSDSRIQYPANQIIVVVLFTYPRKVGREVAADEIGALSDGVARFATPLFKQHFAVGGACPGLCLGSSGPVMADCQM